MARNTSPKKRKHGKPGKPGISPAANRIPYRVYPKRFLVSVPHENNDHPPAEFFYDSQEEAVRQCVTRGPRFFLIPSVTRPSSILSGGLSPLLTLMTRMVMPSLSRSLLMHSSTARSWGLSRYPSHPGTKPPITGLTASTTATTMNTAVTTVMNCMTLSASPARYRDSEPPRVYSAPRKTALHLR